MTTDTESLADFIRRRKGELDARHEQLREELMDVADERRQLARAAAAAKIELEPASAPEKKPGITIPRKRLHHVATTKTMKEAVIEILRDAGHGLTSGEILVSVNELLSADYERTSLSPQLSRLKADGIVKRDGNTWSLVESGPRNTEADDDPGQDQQSSAPYSPTQTKPEDRAGGGT